MAIATDQQVQQYVNQRLRVRAEQFRRLVAQCRDDKLAIEDVYEAVTQQSPTWSDDRTDGPPRLLTPQDVLVFNAAISLFLDLVDGDLTAENMGNFADNWAVFQSACVRPVE